MWSYFQFHGDSLSTEEFMSEDDADYVFQALSNKVRREIIKVLGDGEPLTYSELMSKVGLEDSGTFGFHLRKMRRLIEKSSSGKYTLSKLGKCAYDILTKLKFKETAETKHAISTKEIKEPTIISDRISFEFTEKLARAYHEKGKRVILSDMVSLVIHKMPKDLFDKVVEGIRDCVTVYAPEDLEDLVQLKLSDVLALKTYKDKPPKIKGLSVIPLGIANMLSSLIPNLISGLTPLLSSITSSVLRNLSHIDLSKELRVDEELRLKQNGRLEIEVSGGVLRLKPGSEKPWIKVWEVVKEALGGDRVPRVNVDVKDNTTRVEIERGECEITIPKRYISELGIEIEGGATYVEVYDLNSLKLEVSGGMSKISLENLKPLKFTADIDGGVVENSISLNADRDSEISLSIEGGMAKTNIASKKDAKVSIIGKVEGGFSEVMLDGSKIGIPYEDKGFMEAKSRLKVKLEILGGFMSTRVRREL